MSTLHVTARLRIHDGKLDQFKQIAERCLESVRTKDTGTLRYEWFLNADATECVVLETYRDSDAVFEHIGNLGDTLGELTAVTDMHLEIYGTPSAELIAATADLGPALFAPMGSA